MVLILLAAGFGTRLYPRTIPQPKQLLKIGNSCILDKLLDQMRPVLPLFKQRLLITNNRYFSQFKDWNKARNFGAKLYNDKVNLSKERLGAIGDLLFVLKKANINKNDIFVAATDRAIEFEIGRLIKTSQEKEATTTAALKCHDKQKIKKGSCLKIAKDGRIKKFVEKPKKVFANFLGLPFYVIKSKDFPLLKLIPKKMYDSLGSTLEFMYQKTPIYAEVFDHEGIDLTTEEDYQKAKNSLRPLT